MSHRVVARSIDAEVTRRLGLAGVFLLLQAAPCGSYAGDDNGPASGNEASEPTANALEQITILGQYTPAETARKAQEEAPNLIDIETYEQMRKLPDITTAEAVRRIPGVSIETDEGEGRYVNIRGLDADLNSTTFGGLRLPSTNNASPFGGYRAVTLDSIPIGLVGAITVTKSNLPSMDAEALGGTIEITPKTAPQSGAWFLEGHAGSGYEPLRGKGIIDVAVSGGGRFGGPGTPSGAASTAYSDHPFSVVATITYYEDWRGIDDVEPDIYFNDGAHPYFALADIQQRDYELNRKRHGYGLDLGYQPDADNSYYIRAFEAGYNERYWRQFLEISPDGNTAAGTNGLIADTLSTGTSGLFPLVMALRDEHETAKDQVAMVGGKNEFDGSTLSYRLGYTKGSWYKPYDYNSGFSYTPSLANASINYGPIGLGHTPLYTITGADYLNPANYTLASFSNSSAYNFDKEKSAVIDFEMPFQGGLFESQSLKVGASARLRNKRTTQQPTSYATLPSLTLSSITSAPPERYYSGQYYNPPDIPPGYLQSLLGSGTVAGSDLGSYLQQFLDAKEDVYAAYVQYQMKWGSLGIVAGVRYEGTRDSSDTFLVQTSSGSPVLDANGNPIATPIHASHSYNNVFPGMQARYELRPDLIARASYSSTLARPGFNQVAGSQSVDLGSGQVAIGNPALRAATANSFDLSIEKYLPQGGIVALGVFDKEIKNYIVGDNTGSEILFGVPLRIISFANSDYAYARGVEANVEEKFTMLPGFLSGLGIGGNYTYVDSRFAIRPGEHATLPSSSRTTWNATLFYEKYGVALRLAAYYVSSDLFAIGGDKTTDIYNSSRTFLDFGGAYNIDEHWAVYFNAKNLVNTPHAFYLGTPDRPIQREFYLQAYQLGVRFNY